MEWAAWVVWEEWAAWECNPPLLEKNLKAIIRWPFFLKKNMSKRYSGKSFKDSSVKKKPKLSLKEKRQIKREKRKKYN